MYNFDGCYGPIPVNGRVNLNSYASIYIDGFKKIKEIPPKNLDYINALWDNKIIIENMTAMFAGCLELTKIEGLERYDTSNSIGLNYLFFFCENLIDLDLSTFDTSSVQYIDYTFNHCIKLKSVNLSSWKLDKVDKKYGFRGIFDGCRNLKSFYMNTEWDLAIKEIMRNSYLAR